MYIILFFYCLLHTAMLFMFNSWTIAAINPQTTNIQRSRAESSRQYCSSPDVGDSWSRCRQSSVVEGHSSRRRSADDKRPASGSVAHDAGRQDGNGSGGGQFPAATNSDIASTSSDGGCWSIGSRFQNNAAAAIDGPSSAISRKTEFIGVFDSVVVVGGEHFESRLLMTSDSASGSASPRCCCSPAPGRPMMSSMVKRRRRDDDDWRPSPQTDAAASAADVMATGIR